MDDEISGSAVLRPLLGQVALQAAHFERAAALYGEHELAGLAGIGRDNFVVLGFGRHMLIRRNIHRSDQLLQRPVDVLHRTHPRRVLFGG